MLNFSIIGSSSFLAQAVIKQLSIKEDFNLSLYGKKNIKKYLFPEHTVQSLNLVELLKSDVIIYCAGAGIQPNHSDTKDLIFELNTHEPIRLIELLNENGYKGKLVTFGSYFEIGQTNRQKPYDEADLANHSNTLPNEYSISKHQLTRYIHLNLRKIGFTLYHMILTNIYGIGENKNRLLPYLRDSFEQGRPVNLSSGVQIRQFTHVSDVARCLEALLLIDSKGLVINVTHPSTIQVRDVVLEFADYCGFPESKLNFEAIATRDQTMNYLALDTTKLRSILPEFEFTNFTQGFKEYWIK